MRSDRLSAALIHESTAHTAIADELAQREAQLSVLAGIAQTLARADDPAHVIEEILARSLEVTGVAGAQFVSAEPTGRSTTVTVGDPPATPGRAAATGTEQGRDRVVVDVTGNGRHLGAVVLGSRDRPLSADQVVLCRAIAHQLSQAIVLARSQAELVASREQTIERLARAVALRDGETAEHNQRMSELCGVIAHSIGLDEEQCALIRSASAMHDIGKVATPDSILLKPGPLTEVERIEVERHAETGHLILAGSGSQLLELAATIALCHHERWDGAGYPRGLAGEEIPLEGRIAGVADVFDALTSDRPYRPAMSPADAVEIMRSGRGSHFDPAVFDAFIASLAQIEAID